MSLICSFLGMKSFPCGSSSLMLMDEGWVYAVILADSAELLLKCHLCYTVIMGTSKSFGNAFPEVPLYGVGFLLSHLPTTESPTPSSN